MASNAAKRKGGQAEERPKWVPLREDQHSELSTLARELMLARSAKTERITENTVIRVAVDLMIRHPELLVGDTEDDLRTNVFQRFEQLLERERELLAGGEVEEQGDGQ
ncbi:chromosome segregation ATPases protein (plasmid) [Streptomyces hygroscopicus subsp. jinggangensis 5008]|nr:chromosome segregation ATPases protein [Streptomyces hygroscopicus subsp. jinggangensis 5008]AGF68499.1 chromosome segregation ATPases protein [Streptomyces hygroscopicus subsp. jinggangensis TL01]